MARTSTNGNGSPELGVDRVALLEHEWEPPLGGAVAVAPPLRVGPRAGGVEQGDIATPDPPSGRVGAAPDRGVSMVARSRRAYGSARP